MTPYELALLQLSRLESFANAEGSLPYPPFPMPQDRLRAAGIDPDLWYGLGIVGAWAAMDAFGERKGLPDGQLRRRFGGKVLDAEQRRVLEELDDLRNLFAHNFAGVADHDYLKDRRRVRLKELKTPYTLTCGYQFSGVSGERVALNLTHFRHYIEQARAILRAIQ